MIIQVVPPLLVTGFAGYEPKPYLNQEGETMVS
jgi:hypothetical protein